MLTVEIVYSVIRITVSRRRYVNGGDCVLCNPNNSKTKTLC